jgi:hypothetical protein
MKREWLGAERPSDTSALVRALNALVDASSITTIRNQLNPSDFICLAGSTKFAPS